jgi:multidrug resistance efflux pump
MMRSSRQTSAFGPLAALLLIAGALAACDFTPAAEPRAPEPAEPPAAAPSPTDGIECSGTVREGRAWSMVLGSGERVLSVSVTAGQTVDEGVELMRLEKPELRDIVLETTKRLAKLEDAADERALLELKVRQQRDVVAGWTARIEKTRALAKEIPEYPIGPALEPLTRGKERAAADLAVLEMELKVLENGMRRDAALAVEWRRTLEIVKAEREALRIVAPRRVRVVGVHPLPKRALSGENVLDLVDDEPVHVVAEVPQHLIPLVKPGQRVEILTDGSSDSPLVGEVEAVLPIRGATDERYPRFPVRVKAPDCDGRLVPGMRVTVLIRTGSGEARAE